MLLGLVVAATLTGTLISSCGQPVTCLAVPSCGANEQSSQAPCGAAGGGCRAVTLCEQTIYCRPAAGDAGP